MRTAYGVIVPFGLASLLSTLCMYASPHWACLLLSVLAFGALLTMLVLSAVVGFRRWRKSSPYWTVPAIICFTFLAIDLFMPAAGRRLADYQFKKHLAEYNEVVAELRSAKDLESQAIGEMVRAKHLEYLLQNLRSITAARCDDGSMVVAFTLNTQVILLHEGYLYKDAAVSSSCTRSKQDISPENKWPHLRPVIDNWYHFSDQPAL